jgi:large subunit ribosomal protein L29
MKKKTELKGKTLDEVLGHMETKKAELAKLRFKHRMGQLEKTAELGKLRKEVARLMTHKRELELKKVANAKAN